jgi:hypothetical protein
MDSKTTDLVHLIADGFVCNTEGRGHATPGGRTPAEIVVDATEGFIPLWQPGSILKWRFQERSFALAPDPNGSQAAVVDLMSQALLRWGSAAPVKFTGDTDLWDFELVLRNAPDCTPQGCVLASAFFPDAGRHELTIYPTMFEQGREEQIETLIHEFGHVFGLRHFFATVSETAWPSEIFGTHSPFSIMNYGSMSKLTEADLRDLTELYRLAWSGQLTNINGTPIRFVKPYSATAEPSAPVAADLVAATSHAVEY